MKCLHKTVAVVLSLLWLAACSGGTGIDKYTSEDNPTLTGDEIDEINAELSAVSRWSLWFSQGQLHDANTSESGYTKAEYSSAAQTGEASDSIAFFAEDKAGNPSPISIGVNNLITPRGVSGGWHRFESGNTSGVCGFLGFQDVESSIGATVTSHTFRLIRLSLYKEQIFKDRSERSYDYGYVLADQNPLSFVVVPVFHRRVVSNPSASTFWPKVSVLDTDFDPSPERGFANSEYLSSATCFGTTPAHPISEVSRHITDYTKRYVENQMAEIPIRNSSYQSNLFMIAKPSELWELRTITDDVLAQLQAAAADVQSEYFDDYYPYARAEIANDFEGTEADRYIGMKMPTEEITSRAQSGARAYCDQLGYTSLVGYDLTFSENEGSQQTPRYVWDVDLNDWRAEYDPGDILALNVMGFSVQMPMLYLHNIICANG